MTNVVKGRFIKQIEKGLVTQEEVNTMPASQIQGMIRKRQANKSFQHMLDENGCARCFYSGLPIKHLKTSKSLPLQATAEHLFPQSLSFVNIPGNVVPASSFMNNMVGHAPLSVKYEIRDALIPIRKIVDDAHAQNPDYLKVGNIVCDEIIARCKGVTRRILGQYRVNKGGGSYCWNWWSLHRNDVPDDQPILRAMWDKLLTPEEKNLIQKYPSKSMIRHKVVLLMGWVSENQVDITSDNVRMAA